MDRTPLHIVRRHRLWIRLVPWVIVGLAIAFVGCVGPWPVSWTTYKRADYAKATFRRAEGLPLEPTSGPLRAGVAAVDITPAVGEPLAGYSGREPKGSVARSGTLCARALTLSNGKGTVTIVSGDILVVMPVLRDAVLRKAGLPRHEIYFAATHTHSGPGGYAPGWVEQKVLGEFSQAILDRLADGFVEAIQTSRDRMTECSIAVSHATTNTGLVVNRIDGGAGYEVMACVGVVARDGKVLGGLVTFAAHPTSFGQKDRTLSGDYPAAVQEALAREVGGTWLFAAGAMGSMRAASNEPSGELRVKDVADRVLAIAEPLARMTVRKAAKLADDAPATLPAGGGRHLPVKDSSYYFGQGRSEVKLVSAVLEVDLPAIQYRISQSWRLAPWVTSFLHERRTQLHVVRVNEVLLLGMPCDYSSELARALEGQVEGPGIRRLRAGELIPVITSFNGDYIGYVIPRERYSQDYYESRDMNFFGPWCGAYFQELTETVVARASMSSRDR